MDLGSAVEETGGAEKVISELRREHCGIATTAPGDGAAGTEFSKDDKCSDPAERRRRTGVTAEPTCVAAARIWRGIDEIHSPRTCR